MFKRGISRQELEHFVQCVRQRVGAPGAPAADAAIVLWESALPHLDHRCAADEWPFAGVEETERVLRGEPDGAHVPAHDPLLGPAAQVAATLGPADAAALQCVAAARVEPFVDDSAASFRKLLGALMHRCLTDAAGAGRRAAFDLLVHFGRREVAHGRLRQVAELVRTLRDAESNATRADALADAAMIELTEALRERLLDDPAIQRLGRVLDDPAATPDDVQAVRDILLWLGERIVEPLCELLSELKSLRARRIVSMALAVVAENRPSRLVNRVADKPWHVIRNAAYVLGRIGGSRVLPLLRDWATHEDSRVRVEVARALARVEHSHAVVLLTGMLNDAEYRVRHTAMWAMARRQDPAVLPRLREYLVEDKAFRARPANERDDYFRAYGRLASKSALDDLIEMLDQGGIVRVGWKEELRRGAAIALGECDHPSAKAALQKHVRTLNKTLRRACEHSLEAIRKRAAIASNERVEAVPDRSWGEDEHTTWEIHHD
jgi:HEAT repeat protein